MVEFTLPKNSKVVEGKTHKAPKGTKNVLRLQVYRWNPDEPEKNPRLDTFELDRDTTGEMVLDALLKIKDEIDPTLTCRLLPPLLVAVTRSLCEPSCLLEIGSHGK